MSKDGYITARVDKTLKTKAERVLRRVGVSTTDAITMMLHQIVLREGLPFTVNIPNKQTRKAIAESRGKKTTRHVGSTKSILQDVLATDD